MILHTGSRTDIPAFYSKWFSERLRAGYVLVRNPYDPRSVTRYDINPEVVDLIVSFALKIPVPCSLIWICSINIINTGSRP